MPHQEGALAGSRGVKLFYQRWLPEQAPAGVVALVHGLGGHSNSETFRDLIAYLTAQGQAVYGIDLRGYGRSGGEAGHIDSWNEYRADTQIFLDQARKDFPEEPLFLLGQSLGGLIVLDFLINVPYPLRGAIAAAPALKSVELAPPMVPLVQVVSTLLPTFHVPPHIDPKGLSRDPAKVQLYLQDPLVNTTMTIRLACEYMAAVERVMSQAAKIQTPLLLLHGTADIIEPYQRTEALFGSIPFPQKTLMLYPGAYHGLFMDTDSDEVMADVDTWLRQPPS
jgi:alpha-beta hydrolase superfamily lysophospholipase